VGANIYPKSYNNKLGSRRSHSLVESYSLPCTCWMIPEDMSVDVLVTPGSFRAMVTISSRSARSLSSTLAITSYSPYTTCASVTPGNLFSSFATSCSSPTSTKNSR